MTFRGVLVPDFSRSGVIGDPLVSRSTGSRREARYYPCRERTARKDFQLRVTGSRGSTGLFDTWLRYGTFISASHLVVEVH